MPSTQPRIAVPIVGPGTQAAAEQLARAAEVADLVELRLDLNDRCDVAALVKAAKLPVIVTCRSRAEGGRFEGDERERLEVLRQGVEAGAAYVDVELRTLEADAAGTGARTLLKEPRRAQVIVSYHDTDETPKDLMGIRDRMMGYRPDVAKIVTTARSAIDSMAALELLRSAPVPTMTFCMGERGLASRILAAKFGAFATFASLERGQESAPGQITARELIDIYRYRHIGPNTEVFGVIGNPIGHSLSPHIHNAAIAAVGIDAVYVPFLVDELEPFLETFRALPVRGYSVTIPHKEAAARLADEVNDLVRRTGACNTLDFRNGRFAGANTDLNAALDPLKRLLMERWGRPVRGVRVMMVGAGGVARAIAFGLVAEGADLVIVNRTADRARELAQEAGCRWGGLDAMRSERPEVVINATSVGMSPDAGSTPVPKECLDGVLAVFDTVYNPRRTRLLAEAAECGCATVDGAEMFISQGAAQFKIWTGRPAPREIMKKAFDEAMPET